MKKTLIAFSVTVMMAITVLLAIGFTGCDWFNTNVLNKPNKSELEAREKESKQAELDSIRKAERAKLAALEAKEKELAQTQVGKPYHIIVGAFEEQVNANNMDNLFKSNGYSTEMFNYGGLIHVSAISFETLQEA
ncbi:MAG: hypothetical protein LBR10_10515, partial [Prevotellaceae bacterium]|nr:hypothetical protein [Prevotellaceae bacterium]